MAHIPEVKIEIDWDDNTYRSRYANISSIVLSGSIVFGSSARLSGKSVSVISALGTVVLHATDSTYDPEIAGPISERILRANHACRIYIDDNLFWEGIAKFQSRNFTGAIKTVTWNLIGKYSRILTRNRLDIERLDGGTITDLLGDMQSLLGVSVSGGTAQPVGVVQYRGSGLSFLEAIQRFAGGFIIEDYQGNWSFTRWTDTPDLPIGADFDLTYGPDADNSIQEREGYIRNFCKAVSQDWSASDDSLLAVTANNMSQSEERVFVLAGLIGRERVDSWVKNDAYDIRLSSSKSGVTAAIVGRPFVIDSNTIQIRVRTNAFGSGVTRIRAEAHGRAQKLVKGVEREINIDLHDSQTIFGKQELILPDWFPGGYAGLYEWVVPWLRNLSQPMLIGRISYSLVQPTAAMTRALVDHLTAGKRVRVQTDSILFDTFLLTTGLTWGQQVAPRLTGTGCNVQREPAAPLEVSVLPLDIAANIQVGVPNPNRQNIYGRYRTA